jgi:hypothetical protein
MVRDVRDVSSGPSPDMAMKVAQRKSRPKAALNLNPIIVHQRLIKAGFDFRR